MNENSGISQGDLESLSAPRLICLILRLARRILPLLSKNEQEKRVETAATLNYGLQTVEVFCQSGQILGCGLTSYSGRSKAISNVCEAVCDTVTLKHIVLHLRNETSDHTEGYELYSSVSDIVEKAMTSVRDLISPSAERDLNRSMVADFNLLKDLKGKVDFIDPTTKGPLGELWTNDVPDWYSKLSNDFKSLLDLYQQELDLKIQNSTARCNPEDLADEFRRMFETVTYERQPNPCAYLRDLVVNAYDASLQYEEGRPIRFQLKFALTAESAQVPFTTDYSAKNLVKLAPTIGLGFRHLLVCPNQTGHSLKIRGIADLELHDERRDDPTQWSFVQIKPRPVTEVDLRLLVLGAGHIRIADSSSAWELKDGQIQHFQPIIYVERVQNWLRQAFSGENRYANAVAEFALCKIIQKMVSNGHGGTLLIGASLDERLTYKYKTDAGVLKTAIGNCADLEQVLIQPGGVDNAATINAAHFARRSLTRIIDTVAALTAVDGATVIGNDLSILGFGTEIAYEPAEHNTEIKCLARCVGVGLSTIEVGRRKVADFGMRHRSACGYCGQDKNAIAIVVSQDGGIRVFCTDTNDSVVLYQNVISDRRTWGWLRSWDSAMVSRATAKTAAP